MPTNQTQNPYLPYIQNLLKAADLEMLPEEQYDSYIEDITREIEKRMGLLIMRELSEDDFMQYTKLVTSGNENDLFKAPKFLEEKIENWQDKYSAELKKFADEFVETSKQIKV